MTIQFIAAAIHWLLTQRCIPSTQVPRNSLREVSLLMSHMIAHYCTDLFLNTHARKSQLISRTFPLIVVQSA